MRAFSESDVLDCKACGACCIGKSSDGDYVPVTALDRRRLPSKYVKKLQPVEGDDTCTQALGLKRFGEHESCVALKGTLGKDISCEVYSVRPDFCRTFEKGSDECHARRRAVFFIKPSFIEEQ